MRHKKLHRSQPLEYAGLADSLAQRIPISLADPQNSRRWYVAPLEITSPPMSWLRRFERKLGTGRPLTRLQKQGCSREKLTTAVFLYCDPSRPYLDRFQQFKKHFAEAKKIAALLTAQLRKLATTLDQAEKYRIIRTILDEARMNSNIGFIKAIRPAQLPERAVHLLPQYTSLHGRVRDHLHELETTKFNLKRHSSASGSERLDILLVELLFYVKRHTGRKHYEEISELLQAGYAAFNRQKSISPEMVSKVSARFKDRYPEIWWTIWAFWLHRSSR